MKHFIIVHDSEPGFCVTRVNDALAAGYEILSEHTVLTGNGAIEYVVFLLKRG